MIEPTRFCTSCQLTAPIPGGYKSPGVMRGWRCKKCCEKSRLYQIKAASYRVQQKGTRK